MRDTLAAARSLIPRRYHYPIRQALSTCRSIFYRGSNVYCPWCNGHFRRFLQYKQYIKPFLNTYCPRCYAFERQRLLWLYLKQKTGFFTQTLRVLHFAPENTLQKAFRKLPNLRYISVDLESSLAMMLADITALPFQDNAFDVIFCSHVLEHVVSDRLAMRELHGVLAAGGWAMVLAPVDLEMEHTLEGGQFHSPAERERLFGQHDHVRLYGRDYVERLESVGFSVRLDRYARELDATTVALYGINRDEKLFICTKTQAAAVSGAS